MSLIWVNVILARELFEAAKLDQLLRVDNRNIGVLSTMKNKQGGHTLKMVEKLIRETPIPLCNCADGCTL